MIQTLSKHVKWRMDNGAIFICDCKRLIDLKIPYKYESFIKKLSKGLIKNELNKEEKLVFSDFEKTKLLSELKIKSLKEKDFLMAMEILDDELGKERVRNASFLWKKFKQFPKFFIGIYLDRELIGVICGFPREDYLLISELAIDSRFHGRSFGKKLVEEFEKIAKKENYNKINVGSQDETIGFYSSLNFKPFLLVQFREKDYSKEDFKNFDIIKYSPGIIEVKIKECGVNKLIKLRKKYQRAYFQYIFTKNL